MVHLLAGIGVYWYQTSIWYGEHIECLYAEPTLYWIYRHSTRMVLVWGPVLRWQTLAHHFLFTSDK